MTDTAVVVRDEPTLTPFEVIERVLTSGDLAKMDPADRIAFYWRTCESLGLNPLTRPFEFISLNGKLTLYARKDATDQLRRINGVSVTSIRREKDDSLGLLTVYATGRDRSGREDESSGVVTIKGLSGEALANAAMKAETKAKRRLTLSLVGLGFLDESEVEGEGTPVSVDETGVITEKPKPKTLLEAVKVQQEALEQAELAADIKEDDAVVLERLEASEEIPDATAVVEAAIAEASSTETPTIPTSLTQDELFRALDERRIAKQYAAEVAKTMFPDRPEKTPLTGEQRAELLAALTADL